MYGVSCVECRDGMLVSIGNPIYLSTAGPVERAWRSCTTHVKDLTHNMCHKLTQGQRATISGIHERAKRNTEIRPTSEGSWKFEPISGQR